MTLPLNPYEEPAQQRSKMKAAEPAYLLERTNFYGDPKLAQNRRRRHANPT
ncbi:hypothetical protein GR328_00655 [Microvirga makkahensis]|uniref:Uncharacterized protein n=1 Tax=Microvirga makkahensis TaxID=1128670 RepID=A0A7X3MN76_9HYPH|nr:hypothetical protein [Microvirga makkahensis]